MPAALTAAAIEAATGELLHPQLRAFLADTADETAIPGGLSIRGAAALTAPGLPLDAWAACFPGKEFPAIFLGSDGLGHEFWVHVGSAQVISVHHDSLEEGLSGVRLPADRAAAVQRVLAGRAGLDLAQLLALHGALGAAGDTDIAQFHAICTALGWSVAQAEAGLQAGWAAFLWVRVRDLLEGEGTAGLQAVRDTLAVLASDPGSLSRKRALDLSRAGLSVVPAAVGTLAGLNRVDLSSNPDLDPGSLAGLSALPRLRELSLAGCRLRTIPAAVLALSGLQKLDLSGNPLAVPLPDLGGLAALAVLDLRDTGLDDASLVEGVRAAHPACVIHLSRSVYPMSLGRAGADPEQARVIDLSIGSSGDNALLKELPRLQRFPRLEVLRLNGQRLLTVQAVLASVRGLALRELDLRGLRANDQPLTDLHAQPSLEILRVSGVGWPGLPTAELLRYAATHPRLKTLECMASYDWDGEVPEAQLEDLYLRDVREGRRDEDSGETTLPVPQALRLPRLRSLQLTGHGYALGEELAALPLETVSLEGDLEGLGVLSRCMSLRSLTLRRGALLSPWPDLRALPYLECLAMHDIYRGLEGLLEQIPALAALRSLVLGNVGPNTAAELASVWAAAGLRTLDVSFSGEALLPAGLSRLSTLEDVALRGVRLAGAGELSLPRLRRFWGALSGEGGTARLASLTEAATGLESLEFFDHSLTALPRSLGSLSGLRALSLGAWRALNLDVQPDILGSLSGVTALELSGMRATRLPEGVLAMPLQSLVLKSQESMHWPTVLRQLAQVPTLRRLEILWSVMSEVPAEIAGLAGLESLVVHQSRTHTVHPAIASLHRLQRLQVTASPWSAAARKALQKALPGCEIIRW